VHRALACLLSVIGAASPAQLALDEGAKVRATGNVEEGVRLLLAAADSHPDDPFADDCLAEAARWLSDDLHDAQRSAAIWERLIDRYPASRHARRGRSAMARLRRLLGDGDSQAAQELLRIQRNADLTRAERMAALQALARARPEWAGHARVEEMIATLAAVGPAPIRPAGRGLPMALLAALLLMAVWGRLWRRPLHALWPPPTEIHFLGPIYCVLALASLAQPAGAAAPLLAMLAVVGGGTLVWIWISVAALAQRPVEWAGARKLMPLAAAAFVVGLCVFAVQWQGLGPEILETIRGGPER